MTVVVTGGAGFIGSNLVERLVRDGQDVRVIDNFATGRRENLQSVDGEVEILETDLRDRDAVFEAIAGASTVYHQAALPSVPRSIADPLTTHEVNATGTVNLLDAARAAAVQRVVLASSSSVYGSNPALPKVETMRPVPMSPYAVSKLAAECYGLSYATVYDLEVVALRYFNVFGPRQDPASEYSAVIPKFVTAYLNRQAPTIHGDGEQTRDFTYVENVVAGNLLAATHPDASGRVMNLACGGRYSLNHLAREIARLTGAQDIAPQHAEGRPGDVRNSQADIGQISDLGFTVTVGFSEGLARTIEHYSAQ